MIAFSQQDDALNQMLDAVLPDPGACVLLMRADLDRQYRDKTVLVITTATDLLVSDGVKTSCYALAELEAPRIDEKVGTCALMIKYRGRQTLLATMTNSRKRECRLFVKYLERQLQRVADGLDAGAITADEEDFREDRFCPKCHRPYPNPDRPVCPDCIDRGGTFRRFIKLAKRFRGQVILALGCVAITSLLGILAPYLSTSFFYDQILDVRGRFYGELMFVVTLMLVTQIVTILLNMVCDIVMAKLSARLIYDLKRTIFDNIRRLSMRFFTSRQTGGLMTQINSDADSIYWFFVNCFPYLFASVIQVVTVFVLMLAIDVPLALAVLIPLPLYLCLLIRVIRRQRWLQAKTYTRNRTMNSVLSDSLNGIRVVKAFAREEEETSRFGRASRRAAEMTKRVTVFQNTRHPVLNIIMFASTMLVWGVGGWMTMKNKITYGTLMVFLSYVGILNAPMFNFVNMTNMLSECINAMQRLFEIADTEPDVRECENPVELSAVRGDVEFRDVSFSYEKGRKTLSHISFRAEAGQMLGIVGHSGAGKSTLANLLIRLYDPDEGEILLDGVNIRQLSQESLRRHVSIVSQETYLFMGTILENIAYARPEASRDEILEAARISGAHDFIMKLPQGYNTKIGFGYQDLSGGEKQRLSIARAILKNPEILILDEATAAMDTQTERRIQEALERLSRNRTTICIAHRLSTLRNADHLIVIEKGCAPEHGTHVELLKQKGIYHRLYRLQMEAMKNIGVEE